MIYIDPPYNTGGTANVFSYNNNFNHSTWLTFMKNRLEIAKQLLTEDGFIAISIDHNELFYLGAIADEIFGRDNRLGIITVVHNPMGRNQAKYFSPVNEYMLVYAKSINISKFNNVLLNKSAEESYDLEDEIGKYKLLPFLVISGGKNKIRSNKPNLWYPIYVSKDLRDISLNNKKGYNKILPITKSGEERSWTTTKETFIERLEKKAFVCKRDKNGRIDIYHKRRMEQGGQIKTLWDDKKYNSNHQGVRLLENIIGKKSVSYPKALHTVLDTLKIMTNKDDIILDFCAGSGTTGHAVLALNKEDGGSRRFILVEQLEEHIKICIERNQKIIQQENIQDDFVYCELAKWNETAKEKILQAKNLAELEKLFDELYEKYFLNYNLKIKEFREEISKGEVFRKLDLNQQKKEFIEMLDMNQMYVNYSEREDKKYGISKEDISLTQNFYSKK